MKLFMKQKIFSFRDRFSIYNEQEQPVFYVEGELFSLGKKLHVYDMDNQEVAFIQQKVVSFLPKFYVYVDGQEVAEIVREFTFFKPRYRIEGLHWKIDGDVFEHDYEILQDGHPIVTIHKRWWSFSDAYELNIQEERATVHALAVVLAIDCVLDAAQQASNID